MNARPRILFFGTPAFAVPCLDAALELGDVVTVICQPDRPQGRGLSLVAPATKVRALELGIPIVQPTKVRTPEFAASLRALSADIAVVVAYGRILTPEVLAAPRLGCVNVHASLLPRWRGAAPIQWAIMAGDTETGVCLMQMDAGLDTGPVIARRTIAIGDDTTSEMLFVDLARLGADLLRDALPLYIDGTRIPIPQSGDSTHARMLEKDDARLDFGRTAEELSRQARATTPWPGSECTWQGQRLKLFSVEAVRGQSHDTAPGTLLALQNGAVWIACGHNSVLAVAGVQQEGRKRVRAEDFARSARELVWGTSQFT